jgi:hypothetical protein
VAQNFKYFTGLLHLHSVTVRYNDHSTATLIVYAYSLDAAIENVYVFNNDLTEEEILAYYNGTMWDYDRHCVLALPMLLRDHKPDDLEVDSGMVNGNFSTWTDPTVPDGWDKEGTHNSTNYVEESAGGGCRLVSDGTSMGIGQAIITSGKKYRLTYDVLAVDTGVAKFDFGGTITLDTPGSFEEIITPSTNDFLFYRVGTCDVTIDNVVLTEIKSYTKDRSGNGNDAIFGGGVVAAYPTFSDGKYTFDGSNDYMNVDLGSTPDEFTISIYFKWNSNNAANPIFAFYDSDKKYYLLTKSTNTIFIGFNNKYTGILAGLYNQFNNDNVLSFVFKKGQDYCDIYVNGELYEQKTSGILEAVTSADVANNLFIGGITVSSQYGEADVNNFMFFNTALNPTQILDLQMRMEENFSLGRRGI